jgi:hypothetical protein
MHLLALICAMTIALRKLIVIILAVLSWFIASAQNRQKDAVGWLSLSVKQKIYKNFSYRVMGRLRDGENFTAIKSYYVDGGLYYNININFSVSLNYVYSPSKVHDLYFRTYHQYYTSINNKFPLNNYWYLSNRVILQHTSSFFIIDEGYKPYSRTDLREKLMLNRRLTRTDRLYIGDEVMTTLFTGTTELRRNRLYVGCNHKLTKQLSADLFFVLQSTFNRKVNSDDFIYGFTINYKFRKMIADD